MVYKQGQRVFFKENFKNIAIRGAEAVVTKVDEVKQLVTLLSNPIHDCFDQITMSFIEADQTLELYRVTETTDSE